MRTLSYTRTHIGDPDAQGRFGIDDCMGKVRDWDFQAVIGVGGRGSEAKACGIAYKVNWVGIGAQRTPSRNKRGPYVTFNHFRLFDEDGQELQTVAPKLARRFYDLPHPPRTILDELSDAERAEVDCILALARKAPPSGGSRRFSTPHARKGRCVPKRCRLARSLD
jgi:hypothetical protein